MCILESSIEALCETKKEIKHNSIKEHNSVYKHKKVEKFQNHVVYNADFNFDDG